MAARLPWHSVRVSTSKEDPMFTSIVVGIDRREGGRDALALAALLQAAGGGEVVAVHARASAPPIHEDVLVEVEAALAHAGTTGRALVVIDRSPAHALRTVAEREAAELIVVGSSRRGGAERVLAGDDAAATLHCAPCAVAVAPNGFAGAPRPLRRVGVGLDDSRESRHALDLARRLAHRTSACIRAITVVTPKVPLWPAITWNTAWAGEDASALQTDDRVLAGITAELDEDITPETMVGTPWKELVSRSADLDLLVVGSRAYGPVRRLLLGSTAAKLTRHAACPLLVAPRGAHDTAGGDVPADAPHVAR
jgi:nucleotide-binding universal stress UspA family protein